MTTVKTIIFILQMLSLQNVYYSDVVYKEVGTSEEQSFHPNDSTIISVKENWVFIGQDSFEVQQVLQEDNYNYVVMTDEGLFISRIKDEIFDMETHEEFLYIEIIWRTPDETTIFTNTLKRYP